MRDRSARARKGMPPKRGISHKAGDEPEMEQEAPVEGEVDGDGEVEGEAEENEEKKVVETTTTTTTTSATDKKKKQAPQAAIDEFWKKFTTTTPGKAVTILPDKFYAKRAAASAPKGKVADQKTSTRYEDAVANCKDKVKKIAAECRRVNQKYRDAHFDIEFDLKWGNKDCLSGLLDEESDKWPRSVKRVGDIFDNPKFYVDGATASDVRQGRDGDCWFLAALCTIANMPDLIEKVCVARDEDVGIYGFVFHRDGEWTSTLIDDKLYLTKADYDESFYERWEWEENKRIDSEEEYRKAYQSGSGALYFVQCADENETWLPLLEKAYAKAHGDFTAIEGGHTGEGVEDLTGGVTTEVFSTDILDKEKFWNELLRVNEDFLFGCATGLFGGYGARKGIIEGHAYSVMKAVEIDGQRLLLLRNPWGEVEWTGAWSDGSKEWTPEWMKKLNHRFGDDGAFWISYKDMLRKYQKFDRTRLFGPEWSVTQRWTSLNVPWAVDYHNTKFQVTLEHSGPVVIVLSQLDDRYFRGLEGQYEFELMFRLHKFDEDDYIVRSNVSYCMTRGVSTELELEAGKYTVLMRIIATRPNRIPPPQEVIRKTCKQKRDKLLQIGLSYDLAHAKGVFKESEEEKKTREKREEEEKAKDAAKRKQTRKEKYEKNLKAYLKKKSKVKRLTKKNADRAKRRETKARRAAAREEAAAAAAAPRPEAEAPPEEAKPEAEAEKSAEDKPAEKTSEKAEEKAEERKEDEEKKEEAAEEKKEEKAEEKKEAESGEKAKETEEKKEAEEKAKEKVEETEEAPKQPEPAIKGTVLEEEARKEIKEDEPAEPSKPEEVAEVPPPAPEVPGTQDELASTTTTEVPPPAPEVPGTEAETAPTTTTEGTRVLTPDTSAADPSGEDVRVARDEDETGSEVSDDESILSKHDSDFDETDTESNAGDAAAAAAATAAADAPEEEEDEFEKDPWNAVCVVGLRVYSTHPGVTIEVIRPDDKEKAETTLDLDDSAKDAAKEGEKVDEKGNKPGEEVKKEEKAEEEIKQEEEEKEKKDEELTKVEVMDASGEVTEIKPETEEDKTAVEVVELKGKEKSTEKATEDAATETVAVPEVTIDPPAE